MMKRVPSLMLQLPLIVLPIILCQLPVKTSAQLPGDGAGRVPEVFPRGNSAEGRKTFEAKQCFRCHVIEGLKFPEVEAADFERILLNGDNQEGWTRDHFAAAIMNPDHLVSPDYQKAMIIIGDKLAAENSPMPASNELLTVKDLIALVTFLEEQLVRK